VDISKERIELLSTAKTEPSNAARIVDVPFDQIPNHPQIICFINPNHEYYQLKITWLRKRYEEGLRIKLLYLEGEQRPVGFVEYIPGEYCWRSVDAKGYTFIHCLWINGKRHQHQGLGSLLVSEVEKDAQAMLGVAVVTSDGAFMANREIFLKNGYQLLAESGKDQLLVKRFKSGPLPSINNWESELEKHKDLTIVYSKQCPWVARFIEEIKPVLKRRGMKIRVVELKTAAHAQKAPSLYGVFSLIYKGKLLADRYISTTRFENILKKEFD
jgi:hypothetical protein